MTVISLIAGRWHEVAALIALTPSDAIFHLKLWQLVTYGFVNPPDPFSIVFSILICLQAGNFLEARWGARRVWVFLIAVNALAGIATVLIGLVSPAVAGWMYYGGLTTTSALWVAEGLLIGPRMVQFFSVPISGYALAAIGAAFPAIMTFVRGWHVVLAQLLGLAIVALWVQGYTPQRWWNAFRSALHERALKKRSARLSVISGQKRDRDTYLN
jgi:ABC-type tungstate transport system substrate-binding protein